MNYERDDKLFEKTPTNDTEEEFRSKWEDEQKRLKKQLVSDDTEPWQQDFTLLHYIGGVDVSFVKTSTTLACASLVICDFPELSVVYSDCELVHLDTPYIPGFLAFREVGFFLKLLQKLKDKEPGLVPQVILVDGNGILHPRGFGIASHLGVLSGIPCVGVAKTLMHVDRIAKDEHFVSKVKELSNSGDTFPLVAESGQTIGMALRGGCKSSNPIFISVGHRVSLATAVKLAYRCCRYRVAEPVRQADIRSREFLRDKFPETSPTCKQQTKDASTRDKKRANKERRQYYANETRVGGAKSITCFLDEDSDEESNLASLFDQI